MHAHPGADRREVRHLHARALPLRLRPPRGGARGAGGVRASRRRHLQRAGGHVEGRVLGQTDDLVRPRGRVPGRPGVPFLPARRGAPPHALPAARRLPRHLRQPRVRDSRRPRGGAEDDGLGVRLVLEPLVPQVHDVGAPDDLQGDGRPRDPRRRRPRHDAADRDAPQDGREAVRHRHGRDGRHAELLGPQAARDALPRDGQAALPRLPARRASSSTSTTRGRSSRTGTVPATPPPTSSRTQPRAARSTSGIPTAPGAGARRTR